MNSQGLKFEEVYISDDGETILAFKEFIEKSDLPVTLVFFSDWCYPCRKIFDKAVLNEISQMSDIIYFITADDSNFDLNKNLKDKSEYEKYYRFSNSEVLFEGYDLMKFLTGKTEFPFIAKIEKNGDVNLLQKIGELKKEGKLIEAIKSL